MLDTVEETFMSSLSAFQSTATDGAIWSLPASLLRSAVVTRLSVSPIKDEIARFSGMIWVSSGQDRHARDLSVFSRGEAPYEFPYHSYITRC
jgi:hypothetical protein